MKKMEKGLLIPWAGSLAATIVCILIVLLDAGAVVHLSDGARNALALTVTAALVVFGYTSCKHAGVLKSQRPSRKK